METKIPEEVAGRAGWAIRALAAMANYPARIDSSTSSAKGTEK